MAELDSLPQDRIDVVIGLSSFKAGDNLEWVKGYQADGIRTLIAYPSATPAAAEPLPNVEYYAYPPSTSTASLPGITGEFVMPLQIAQRLAAKACCVWNTPQQGVTASRVAFLLEPVLSASTDVAFPLYDDLPFGALVNHSIIYPMARSLYGKRLRFPMAIDLAFSPRLGHYLLQPDPLTRRPRATQWIASQAICAGMDVCQVHFATQPPTPSEAIDLSSVLSLVLSNLFLDMERNTSFWQRTNASQSVRTLGEAGSILVDGQPPADIQPMIEGFHLAFRNLSPVWAMVLPPANMLELKKLTRLSREQFIFPDDLWVRIVYDFALGHRQRSINRDHLLRALTPLYLAWVASYVGNAGANPGMPQNMERLAAAYEKEKPYLVSRWRSPDRFNP